MIPKNVVIFYLIISIFSIEFNRLNAQASEYTSLSNTLAFLSEKHGVFFTYNPEVIKNQKTKIKDFEELSIDESVTLLKKTTPYKIDYLGNNYYVLFEATKNHTKTSLKKLKDSVHNAIASHSSKVNQTLRKKWLIKGIVLDPFNIPVEKANIIEKNTKNGTITLSNGTFELVISGNGPIEISHIGYNTQLIYPTNNFTRVHLKSGVALDEVFVVGSRNNNRQKIDAPVSTDIIDIQEVKSKSECIQLNQFIQNEIPSFNATKQSGSDGSDHIVPATYRGLGPDQTLVLINGKRRHQASLINLHGTRGRGNSGTDLDAIPSSAIKRIEVLKDGASAQYGSDAIAGVINIVLNDQAKEGQVNSTFGFYNAFKNTYNTKRNIDGITYKVDVNYGSTVRENGFINLAAELLTQGHTFRNGTDIRENYGDPATTSSNFFVNTEIPIKNKSKVYLNAGFSYKNTRAYAFTRRSNSERNIPEIYPTGFNPLITSDISDSSLTIGTSDVLSGWNVDLSNTYGKNYFNYWIKETLNASLLEKSPKEFDAGGHSLMQNTTNFDISKNFKKFLKGLHIAAGIENRIENYIIFSGEKGAYEHYDIHGNVVTDATPLYLIPTHDGKIRPGGSQGFPGYAPSNEVDKTRTSISLYFDSEIDVTKKWLLATAIRYEKYSDFGNSVNTKIATRYKVTPKTTLRFSYSTGFRAPSLAQIYYNLKFTNYIDDTAVESFLIANNDPVTEKFGIEQLREEKAINYSLGIHHAFRKTFKFSIDSYFIFIKDRIILSGNFDATALRPNVEKIQFFANGVNTSSIGLDFRFDWLKYFDDSKLTVGFTGNVNSMEITEINHRDLDKETFFGVREQYFLLASAPKYKLILNATYSFKNFSINSCLTKFSNVELIDWKIFKPLSEFNNSSQQRFNASIDYYKSKYTLDTHFTYDFSPHFSLQAGTNNLFNTYPTEQSRNTDSGGLWDAVQMGSKGSFYYSKVLLKF